MSTWGLSRKNIFNAAEAGHIWTEGTGLENPAECKTCNSLIENCTIFYKINTKGAFKSDSLSNHQDKAIFRAVPRILLSQEACLDCGNIGNQHADNCKAGAKKEGTKYLKENYTEQDLIQAQKIGYNDALELVLKAAQYKFGPTHSFIAVLNALKGN